jgi:hypothetical protein
METVSPTDTVWPAASGPEAVNAVAVAVAGSEAIATQGWRYAIGNAQVSMRAKVKTLPLISSG